MLHSFPSVKDSSCQYQSGSKNPISLLRIISLLINKTLNIVSNQRVPHSKAPRSINLCYRIGGAMKQPSMASDLRMPEEEDNESMADYADGVGDGKSFYFEAALSSVNPPFIVTL